MNCALSRVPPMQALRDSHYQQLMTGAIEDPNSAPLAEIISSWQAGIGVLPQRLGLSDEQFTALHQYYFVAIPVSTERPNPALLDHRLDDLRQDLLKLLLLHRRDDSPESSWIAELIATACQGSNHLWEDLGVWNRASLGLLLRHNFPALAERNTRDMKWKKFLFKQLCETEGIYICRAPTCDECSDFDDCFGPE